MSENNCAVYVHINLINGKKYFGITIQEPEMRWKNGNGYYNNAHFKNAIKKYSWENFAHYVLFKNIPIAIAKNIEEMLIREHMSYDPRFGYNKTMGGELERHTKETRRKMRLNHADMSGKNNPMYGKHLSEETRNKIGKNRSKPVEAIDQESGQRVLYFKSTRAAGRAGFDQSDIVKCCNGKQKTHKGYIWRYVEGGDNDGGDN